MSRVCSIHQEYCPDGACRWCDPVEGLQAAMPAESIFGIDNIKPLLPVRPRSSEGCYRRFCMQPVVGAMKHPYAPGGEVAYCAIHGFARYTWSYT